MPTVLWFPVPSQEGHSLENYIRGLPGASKREKYWHEGAADIVLIGKSDGTVEKFENMLRENGLDVNLAEEIIYRYASSPGGIPPDSDGEIETNEYKFLSSLGIVQGLEIYWFDMEWGDMAKYSYERAEVPGVTGTRKMSGQPIAYEQNKGIIRGVVRRYLENRKAQLGLKIKDYSGLFLETALIGTRGYLRPHRNNFISEYEMYPNWTFSVEAYRLGALAANPFISSKIWEFGKKLIGMGIGIQQSVDLITAPYKLISDVFGFSGSITEKEDNVNRYLAWWILYRGGLLGKNIPSQCDLLGVPLEDVLKCVDETFSKKLTSRYIKDSSGIGEMSDFLASHGESEIKGISNISVFRKQEFEAYCTMKITDALSNIY